MRNWLAVLLLPLLLSGCGKTQLAPVADRSIPARSSPSSIPSWYTVRKGDTLYSISWRYGLDFRRIARLNRIGSKYAIYPGQRLRLKGKPPAVSNDRSKNSQQKVASKKPSNSVQTKKATRSQTASTLNNRMASSGNQTANKATKSVKAATVTKHKDSPKVSSTSSRSKSAKVGNIRWQWPAKGRVIESFRTRGRVNKGINIAGRRGDPVYAAASGEVVYAGNGLLGYGNLVIINHNGLYMSAYAHSSRVFVKERDRVSRGDRIAEIGSSGTDRHMLHFEIRRDGNPVNPVKYLPKR